MSKLYVQGVVKWQWREAYGHRPIMVISVEGEGAQPIRGLDRTNFLVSVRSSSEGWKYCHVWDVKAAEAGFVTGSPYGFYEAYVGPPFPYARWEASWMADDCVFTVRVTSDQGYGQALASNFTPAALPGGILASIKLLVNRVQLALLRR